MLQDKLNELKAASAAKVPAEIKAIMQRATEKLASSDILQRVIKEGETCPDFTLNDAHGRPMSLQELRQQGPVLISLYRGVW